VCKGSNLVVCAALDACHVAGTCNPSSGACSNPAGNDGVQCNDNNACTQSETCSAGTCQGGTPVSADDGDACTADSCDPIAGVKHVPVTNNPTCAKWYSGGLKLEVRTSLCGQNQVQQFFQVTNTGSSAVNLSDIALKYWVNDTNGSNVAPEIYNNGCVIASASNPTCLHPVLGVTAAAAQIGSTCGPDANQQANWGVAIKTTDGATLQPGQLWNDIQTTVHLANFANFSPGTSQWYSPCLTSTGFATDSHFAVYYKGNLVFSSGLSAPTCDAPSRS
jgi:hypothetical protein